MNIPEMSHKTTHRGALPVPTSLECPLASLGRNSSAVMDSGHHHHHHHQPPYHHPLSSSPLDPQIYQMSRNSPVLSIAADDIIYTSSVSQQGDVVNSLINVLDNEEATTSHTRARLQQLYQQQQQQQREQQQCSRSSSPSSFRQSINFDYHGRHDMHSNGSSSVALNQQQQQQQHQRNMSAAQERNLLALDLEHLLQYGAGRPPKTRTTYLIHSTSNGHNSEDSSDAAPSAPTNANENDYLEKKMDDLYLGSAMRGLPIGSETNHFQNDAHYFLDESLRNMCDYNHGNNHTTANGHLLHHQRASSPSETSGSDRYLLNRTSSPANAFSSSNNNTSTSNLALDQQRQLHPHQHVHNQHKQQQLQQLKQPQQQPQIIQPQQRYNHNNNNNNNNRKNNNNKINNLTNGFCNLGRFSPSLDQGYATLVSPSPTTGHHPNHITTHSIVHQPPAHTLIHASTNMATVSTRGRRETTDETDARLPPWNKKGPFRSGPLFDRLSDDAVLNILSWLDNCELCIVARVCRRFEQLSWRPILWRVISLKGDLNGDKTLKMIFRQLCGQSRNGACSEVERVLLSDGCRISDKGLQLLMRRCPELTHLQLHNCVSLTNQALIDVLTKCSNLQHLDVTGCTQVNCISPNPNIEPPRRLLLQYLDLSDCMALDDLGVKILVKYCPQLVYLYLRRCIQITDAGLKYVPSFCVALKELSVSDCVNITDFGLYELAKLGAALRYLSVAKCDRVSDAGLKVIARRCYKLRYLNARGCEAVSDDSITVLAHSCPRLRALDIGKCDVSDAGLRALAESCPNLKKLSLRNCDMITDRGVQCIAYYCRGLQQLNIQDCQISIEGYRAVKKYCRRCIIEHTNPGFC